MTDFNEFRLWKKEKIQEYLRISELKLPTTGNKNELIALATAPAFGASYFSIEQKASTKYYDCCKGTAIS